jgi:signal transduction histidine kinase/ActR/RegA family two-component response regulator
MTDKESENLFEVEEKKVRDAEALVSSQVFESDAATASYGNLLKDYKKLLRQAKRLVRLGDMAQSDLNRLNQELLHAQEMLKRHNEYLSALHQTTLGLIGRRELTDLLETLIKRAAQLLGTTDGLFYMVDPAANHLELKVGIGRFVKYIGTQLDTGEGLCGKVWQTGKPRVIEDYATWPGHSEKMKDGYFGAAIAVPLKSEGQVLGVISITSSRTDRIFDEEDIEILTRFAGIASIALDNALLYEATREAREAAEAANRAKSDFLASMSHEIRTPMNAILGMAELLSESPLNSEQQKYVRISRNSGQGLLDIINDILDISKVEAGQLVLEHTSFDLQELIESTCELMTLKTDEKGLALICRISPLVPCHLLGDPGRLRQILINLLGNAMKFTHEGEIILECGLRNGERGSENKKSQTQDSQSKMEEVTLQFSVRDTGIGIPEAKQKAIFERFTQADSSTTRKYGGTGLGLNICQRLVELMDGEIWVEGRKGEGSTFAFTARFGIDKTPRDRKKPKEAEQDQKMAAPSEVRPLRILLVEDAKENRIVVKAFLKKTPHTIEVAENGKVGVDKFLSGEYDLVLMDMRMPVMDGYTATGEIRKWEEAHQRSATPVIALTAHALREDRQKCLDAGCTDYLPKPLKKQDLLNKILEYSGNF